MKRWEILKRWKTWILVFVALSVWGGAAAADLFYAATDSNRASVGLILGKDYRIHKDLSGNFPQYAKVFSFKDPNGKFWAVVDEYSFSSAAQQDTINIFDPQVWDEPHQQLTTWGRNLYGLATSGQYLFVVAFDKREGAEEKSGEIVRVDMTQKGFPSDKRYPFEPYPLDGGESILRRPCAVQVINEKIYVLTYTYDGVHNGNAKFNDSEVFEFDQDLNLLRKVPLGAGSREAKNAQRMQVFNGKLYVGTTGGAQTAEDVSIGGIWEIDPSSTALSGLSEKKILDLNTLADPDLAGKEKGVLGLGITKDGAVYLLVGGYDSASKAYISKLYVSTVARLSEGDVGESIPSLPPVSGMLYDEPTETLWTWTESWLSEGGGTLYAYDKDANPLETFTPADLGNNVSFVALLEGVTLSDSSEGNGSGGGCDAGLGSVTLLLTVVTLLIRHGRYKRRRV